MNNLYQHDKEPGFIRMIRETVDPDMMAGVFVRTYDRLDKPGEERWSSNSYFRSKLLEMATEEWCFASDLPRERCPLTEDMVSLFHIRFRKLKDHEKTEVREHVGLRL